MATAAGACQKRTATAVGNTYLDQPAVLAARVLAGRAVRVLRVLGRLERRVHRLRRDHHKLGRLVCPVGHERVVQDAHRLRSVQVVRVPPVGRQGLGAVVEVDRARRLRGVVVRARRGGDPHSLAVDDVVDVRGRAPELAHERGEAAGRREEVGRVGTQVPLPDEVRRVPALLQRSPEGRGRRRQGHGVAVHHDASRKPVAAWVAAGHQCCARRRAQRLGVVPRQRRARLDRRREGRCRPRGRFPKLRGVEVGVAEVVDHEEHEVGARAGLLRRCRRRRRDHGQHGEQA